MNQPWNAVEPTPRRAPVWVLVLVLAVGAGGIAVLKLPPWSFLTRADLASCGEFNATREGAVPDDAVACLLAAQTTGSGAELKVTDRTDEGDAIISYFRSVPGHSGVEVFTDSHDGYGKKGWSHDLCPQARSVADLGECRRA